MAGSKQALEKARHHLDALTVLLGQSEQDIIAYASQIARHSQEIGKQISDVMATCRVMAHMQDTSIPAKYYESVWVSRPTIYRYIREEGLPHDYREGKLCFKPKDFFAIYDKQATSKSSRKGRPRKRQKSSM